MPTVFRDHLALGYEILKWETDLAQPTVFLPLAEPGREKVASCTSTTAPARPHLVRRRNVLGPDASARRAVSRPVRRGVPRRQDGARDRPVPGVVPTVARRSQTLVRVLLTGHRATWAPSWPRCSGAGHDVTGLDSGLFADCVLGGLDAPDVRAWPSTCATSPSTSSPGSTRSSTWRRCRTTRWARSPPRSPTTSTTTRPPGWPAWPRRRASGGSSTPRRARCTGASGDGLVAEDAPLKPVTPTRAKVRVEDDLSRSPTTTSCRSRCATRPRSGSRRGCAPTSCSTTSSATPCSPAWSRCCPTARRGVRWCTPATSPRRLAGLDAPADVVRAQAFNVGTEQQPHGGRDRPDRRRRRARRELGSPARRAATRAPTASTSPAPARARLRGGWTCRTAPCSSRRIPRARSDWRAVRAAVHPAGRARGAAAAGELDATMRVRRPL